MSDMRIDMIIVMYIYVKICKASHLKYNYILINLKKKKKKKNKHD